MAMRVQLSTASLDGESGYHPMDAKGELFDETVNEEVVPERMQYKHLPNAVDATLGLYEEDPLVNYLIDTPDRRDTPVKRAIQWLGTYAAWSRNVRDKTAWTIHGGSFIVWHPRPDDQKRRESPLEKITTFILSCLRKLSPRKEQTKRIEEYNAKREKAVETALGDKIKDMVYIDNLITLHQYRGQGYASALVRLATSLADREGRETWLVSSNIANVGFYNYLGFTTVNRFSVGENNPTWNKGPILVDVMVRAPVHQPDMFESEKAGALV